MNQYESNERDCFLFGTLIVQVLDRLTEEPADQAYVGLSRDDADDAVRMCCGTHVAVTAKDGLFSYRLPAGRWVLALSRTNWREVWVCPDETVEVTVIHHPGDQIGGLPRR